MRPLSAKLFLVLLLGLILGGCDPSGDTSGSVKGAKRMGRFVAEYDVPLGAQLGEYRPLEVWVERRSPSEENILVLRLKGPHHGGGPRVWVKGINYEQYGGIWSARNGPPYEYWMAPESLPEVLTLERKGATVVIRRKGG